MIHLCVNIVHFLINLHNIGIIYYFTSINTYLRPRNWYESFVSSRIHSYVVCPAVLTKSHCDWTLLVWSHVQITELQSTIPRTDCSSTFIPIRLPVVTIVTKPSQYTADDSCCESIHRICKRSSITFTPIIIQLYI